MIPTFKFHGSKARIAKWIFSRVDFDVNNYYEPFAGRGNAFFYFAAKFGYGSAQLNDLYLANFLIALRDYSGNYDFVPEWIDRDIFEKFKSMCNCHEKLLAESFCAYNGTFYKTGANLTNSPDHPSKNKHGRTNTVKRMTLAKKLLNNVNIYSMNYREFLDREFHKDDLVYCDPPYLGRTATSLVGKGIDHKLLAEILSKIDCKIILSGYDNAEYDRILSGFNKRSLVRSSCGRNSGGNSHKAIEWVWENF